MKEQPVKTAKALVKPVSSLNCFKWLSQETQLAFITQLWHHRNTERNGNFFPGLPALPFCSIRFLMTASLCTHTSETGELGSSVWQHPPRLQGKLMAVQKCAYLRLWNELVIASLAWKEHSFPLSVSQSLHHTTLHATAKSSSLCTTHRHFWQFLFQKYLKCDCPENKA